MGADSKMVNYRLIQGNWLVPALLSNPVRMGEDRLWDGVTCWTAPRTDAFGENWQ